MWISLPAIEELAPLTGGVVLASALSYLGGLFVSRYQSDRNSPAAEYPSLPPPADQNAMARDHACEQLTAELGHALLSTDDFRQALTRFCERLAAPEEMGIVALVGVDPECGWPPQGAGVDRQLLQQVTIPHELLCQLQADGEMVVTDRRYLSRFRRQLDPDHRRPFDALYLTAFHDGDVPFTVMISSCLRPTGFSRLERRACWQRIAPILALRWRQARLLEQQSRELCLTRELLALRGLIDAETEPHQTLDRFLRRLGDATDADRMAIYFVSRRQGERLQPVAQRGGEHSLADALLWRRVEQQLASTAIAANEAAYYDRASLSRLPVGSSLTSAATFPIRVRDRVLGALCVSAQKGSARIVQQSELLEAAAAMLSHTLGRVLDDAVVRRQARHDHLTDLVNRRSFDAYLATEFERIQHGESRACSLIMADLDRFKSYNDRYGHPAGDQILRSAARTLSEQVSRLRLGEHSIVARYGGEEFAILLPNVGLAGALRIAEGIRSALARTSVPLPQGPLTVTASLGVASAPTDGPTPDALIAAADEALYRAKSRGRNRVCQAERANDARGSLAAPVLELSDVSCYGDS